jgi:hypothetical protein
MGCCPLQQLNARFVLLIRARCVYVRGTARARIHWARTQDAVPFGSVDCWQPTTEVIKPFGLSARVRALVSLLWPLLQGEFAVGVVIIIVNAALLAFFVALAARSSNRKGKGWLSRVWRWLVSALRTAWAAAGKATRSAAASWKANMSSAQR